MNSHRLGRWIISAVACAALIQGGTAVVSAQIPEKFKNLRVLPKDITRQELVFEMREIAGSLGVRCGHCHAGGNPATLEGVDFASDSLESKRVARVMMRMTRDINSSLLPQTGRDTTRLTRVRCVTCHRSALRPETLADTLLRALDAGGADSAAASYRALREKYYGRAVFDFGEGALQWIAEQARRRSGGLGATIALCELNLEFFPKSVNTRSLLGDALIAKGDTAAAIKRWQEAIALDPSSNWIKSKVEAARGPRR